MRQPLITSFDPDEIPEAPSPAPVLGRGDLVEFWLEDRSLGIRGRIAGRLGPDRVKVRVEGVGSFSVPAQGCVIIARAQ